MLNRYRRAVLKISGEALAGTTSLGHDWDVLEYVAKELAEVQQLGIELGIVVGGGNIWRGATAEEQGMDRTTADHAGMLATIINALALQDALERVGIETRTQTSIEVTSVAEPYIRRRAMRHLEKRRVVIFAGGTGNPFMTTDTAAALKAVEITADVLLMAKNKVDGVYDSDPNLNPDASKFDNLTHLSSLTLGLEIMDRTALALCMDNQLPILVFDLFKQGNLAAAVSGMELGTLISTP
ncbi:MAG: UMP kinase [Chloroflexi bacterium]|nr:UMP kinase [Chloroflexota bacterium]|tara:strand:+ start:36 stop:755 length:720 start_codon:yes stop_codon:yes gene_type:complete